MKTNDKGTKFNYAIIAKKKRQEYFSEKSYTTESCRFSNPTALAEARPFFAFKNWEIEILEGKMVHVTKIATTAWKKCGALIILFCAVAHCSCGTSTISSAALRVRGGSTATSGEITNRWQGVPMAPADPILGVAVAFNADPSPRKINLGIGAYRTSEGVIYCCLAIDEN